MRVEGLVRRIDDEILYGYMESDVKCLNAIESEALPLKNALSVSTLSTLGRISLNFALQKARVYSRESGVKDYRR
jgi:hypothetical protein